MLINTRSRILLIDNSLLIHYYPTVDLAAEGTVPVPYIWKKKKLRNIRSTIRLIDSSVIVHLYAPVNIAANGTVDLLINYAFVTNNKRREKFCYTIYYSTVNIVRRNTVLLAVNGTVFLLDIV